MKRILLFFAVLLLPALAFGSVKQEVYLSGTVQSFGGYTFSRSVGFTITQPGKQEIGTIAVDGLYNGEYPWVMRVYTDNAHFSGVAGVGQRPSSVGLISKDGQFSVPIEIHSSDFGPDVWRRIPDLNEPNYLPYQPSAEPGKGDYTDCVLMGIDPRNASWVAGHDGTLFTEDDNLLGDITTKTPFELFLRADVSPTAVQTEYEGILYIEIVGSP